MTKYFLTAMVGIFMAAAAAAGETTEYKMLMGDKEVGTFTVTTEQVEGAFGYKFEQRMGAMMGGAIPESLLTGEASYDTNGDLVYCESRVDGMGTHHSLRLEKKGETYEFFKRKSAEDPWKAKKIGEFDYTTFYYLAPHEVLEIYRSRSGTHPTKLLDLEFGKILELDITIETKQSERFGREVIEFRSKKTLFVFDKETGQALYSWMKAFGLELETVLPEFVESS